MTTPFISAVKAAELADVSRTTIHTWCAKYDLGKKVGGRWRIDPDKLERFLSLERTNGKI